MVLGRERRRTARRRRTDQPTTEPVEVGGGLAVELLAPGEELTCGLTVEGIAHCWGGNRAGWLGDGTVEDRLDPTPVSPVASVRPGRGPTDRVSAIRRGDLVCVGADRAPLGESEGGSWIVESV